MRLPVGGEGALCNHCVAACLAWRAQADGGKPSGCTELRAYLAAQTHDALVGMLLEAAGSDPRLYDRVARAAAIEGERATRLATFRASIDSAVATRGFVSWSEMWEYASGIDEVSDGLERLLAEGHADDVIACRVRAGGGGRCDAGGR